jgi:hypothetical protein
MTEPLVVQYNDGQCAVEGCTDRGRPQVCPYDGRYHRHGKVHYANEHPWHPTLAFRSGAWRGICDRHYEVIIGAARAAQR